MYYKQRPTLLIYLYICSLYCVLQAIYMFYALAIVCDDYFVPSLEKISEVRKTEPTCFNYLFC